MNFAFTNVEQMPLTTQRNNGFMVFWITPGHTLELFTRNYTSKILCVKQVKQSNDDSAAPSKLEATQAVFSSSLCTLFVPNTHLAIRS